MMNKIVNKTKETRTKIKTKAVTNFMGGTSYEINPLDTLKMITASSIFGEPSYYRDGEFDKRQSVKDGVFKIFSLVKEYSILDKNLEGKTTSKIMEEAIDNALSYDFKGTLEWAVELRKDYFMRLNPQVIMVRAAMHPNRVEFNEKNPGVFTELNKQVMSRADEPASQFAYYLYKNSNKNNLPNLLKRNWKSKLESLTKYELSKYKNTGLGIIDVVRVSHANNEYINELMKTGKIEVDEDEKTWENLRSQGKTWKEILSTIKLGHMALLRNLRGIFEEAYKEKYNKDFALDVLTKLKAGVLKGKQFPFRYYTAYNLLSKQEIIAHKGLLLDALEECMDISLANLPELKGNTLILTDNSGSAWGTIPSEYGSVCIAEINNLSSVILAKKSESGTVVKFGDKIQEFTITKRNGVLNDTKKVNTEGNVGRATEHGIWLSLDKITSEKEHYDNIFIFSDMQAGHGKLYGDKSEINDDDKVGNSQYIDVLKMVKKYRSTVNPKVNLFTVQTAGYDNVLLPEYLYRGNVLYGWTGKEALFANKMNEFWDNIDERSKKANK